MIIIFTPNRITVQLQSNALVISSAPQKQPKVKRKKSINNRNRVVLGSQIGICTNYALCTILLCNSQSARQH